MWPHVTSAELATAYAQMVAEEERETEATEWVEALLSDVADEESQSGEVAAGPPGLCPPERSP